MMCHYKLKVMGIFLSAVIAITLAVQAGAVFTDIPPNAWYASDVKDIQRYGLISGVGNGHFNPNGKLSLAQAITLSARTHAALEHRTIDANGSPWYQPYMDYAVKNGIYTKGEFGENYNSDCSRLTMAVLFQRVFPQNTEQAKNTVAALPDVQDTGSGESVFYLYRQGVLSGSDAYGTFNPNSGITRAEAAAILNRVMDSSKRKTFTLKTLVYPIDFAGRTVGELKQVYGNDLAVETENVWYGATAFVWYKDGRIPGFFYANGEGSSVDDYKIGMIEYGSIYPYPYTENYRLSPSLWTRMTLDELKNSGYEYEVVEYDDAADGQGSAVSCFVQYDKKIDILYSWWFLGDDYNIRPDPAHEPAHEIQIWHGKDWK